MPTRLTQIEFIDRAIELYGSHYTYNEVVYKNTLSKVIIVCKIHGEFEVTPGNFLSGHGCKICGLNKAAEKKEINSIKKICTRS